MLAPAAGGCCPLQSGPRGVQCFMCSPAPKVENVVQTASFCKTNHFYLSLSWTVAFSLPFKQGHFSAGIWFAKSKRGTDT